MLTPMADDADATLAVRSTTAGDVTTTLSVYDTICRSLGWGAPGFPGVPEYIIVCLLRSHPRGLLYYHLTGHSWRLYYVLYVLYYTLYYIIFCIVEPWNVERSDICES